MRIARFTTGDDPRFGIVTGDVDDFGIPDEGSVITALSGDPLYVGLQPIDEQHRLAAVPWLLSPGPAAQQGGRHRAQLRRPRSRDGWRSVPEEPLMFLKPNTSVVGPGDPVFYPSQSENVHFEGELGVVIGRICRDVPKEKAADVIHGYTIGNDVTARDLQKKDGQFTRAKGFDSFCPLGPWIETRARRQRPAGADLPQRRGEAGRSHLGPDLRRPHPGRPRDQRDDPAPGGRDPHRHPGGVGPMEPGDEVEVSIQGIGNLTNRVVSRD